MKFFLFCLSLSILFSIKKWKTYEDSSSFLLKNNINKYDNIFIRDNINSKITWQHWNSKTLDLAKKSNKLIFLYVGYSGCGPCYHMQKTTFSNENLINTINQKFIPIIVDKDFNSLVGRAYLEAQTALQKMGRWPLTMVINPNLEPLFAASVVPANDLDYALKNLSKAWEEKNNELIVRGEQFTQFLNQQEDTSLSIVDIDQKQKELFEGIKKLIDPVNSGYQSNFKFPMSLEAKYLLRYFHVYQNQEALKMVRTYFNRLLFPKLFDWVNGGFFRYCVNPDCTLTQFEKLSVDQALHIDFLSEYFSITKSELAAHMIDKTVSLLKEKFYQPHKGISLSLDSYSNNIDGEYYKVIFNSLLSFGVKNKNFQNSWNQIISNPMDQKMPLRPLLKMSEFETSLGSESSQNEFISQLNSLTPTLVEFKNKTSSYPRLDNQVLTSDNGLMIASLAKASRALSNANYLKLAQDIANDILTQNRSLNGELYHSNQMGHLSAASALDYSYFIYGLIELNQADQNKKWINLAKDLQLKQIEVFWDKKKFNFNFYSQSNEIPFKKINYMDNLYPSENSLALDNLFRLSKLTNKAHFFDLFQKLKNAYPNSFHDYPWYFTQAYSSLWRTEHFKVVDKFSNMSGFLPFDIIIISK